MARTLLDLQKSMALRAAALQAHTSELDSVGNRKAIAAATAIVHDLAQQSPVDTSLFVSNWQLRLNERAMVPIPAYFPGEAADTKQASGAAMVRAALETLRAKKPGDTIYISNVLPYAEDLDSGTSIQQPAGMTYRAAIIGRKVAESTK